MDMAISAAQLYESKGVVCPLVLRKNLFTTAAVDNLENNPSSTTAQGALHGTSISLFQNRETNRWNHVSDTVRSSQISLGNRYTLFRNLIQR